MKFLILLVFVGFASASFKDAIGLAADEIVSEFVEGMEQATPLKQVLGLEDFNVIDEVEQDLKEQLANHLREALEQVLRKIDDAITNGKEINEAAVAKLKELREEMKTLDVYEGVLTKEIMEDIKNKAKGYWNEILEKMGINKRSADMPMESILGDLSLRELFLKLKDMVLEKMDVGSVKESLDRLIGRASQTLCTWLADKGKEKLMNFFDRILEGNSRKRSVSDVYEKIRDYFKDMDIDLKEKFTKFGEWAKEVVEKGLDRSKNRVETIKKIAREFMDSAKRVSKDVARQALEFLHEYRNELGSLYYEVKEKLKEIINKKED